MRIKNFCLLLSLLIPSYLQAFEMKEISISGNLQPLRWETTSGPIRITLNAKGSQDMPLSDLEEVVRNALNEWQSVPGDTLSFQYAGTSASAVINNTDSMNSIIWIEKGWQYSSAVLGVTKYSYWLEDPPVLADVDIQMNGQHYTWKTDGGGTHPQQVLLHELGHLLGLSHTSVLNASLYPFLGQTVRLKLSKDDKSAARFLYGQPVLNFQTISPIHGSTYPDSISDQGLPLPTFRWGSGGLTNFSLEFSQTKSFDRKKTIPVGQNTFFPMSSSLEESLLQLSPGKNVYWRVSSGSSVTRTRVLRFRPALQQFTELGAIVEADGELFDAMKHPILLLTSGLLVSALLILLLRIHKRESKSSIT